MKGQGAMAIIVLIVAAIVIGIFMVNGGKSNVVVIANQTVNQTYSFANYTNQTIVINNTINPVVSARNVSVGDFGEDTPGGNDGFRFLGNTELIGGGALCGTFTTIDTPACGTGLDIQDSNSKTMLFIDNTDVNILNAANAEMYVAHRTAPSYNEFYVNTTFDAPVSFAANVTMGDVCDVHIGTQLNYSRCLNATGQLVETFGVFPL